MRGPACALTHAVEHALARGAASLETIKMLLEQSHERPEDTAPPSIVRAVVSRNSLPL